MRNALRFLSARSGKRLAGLMLLAGAVLAFTADTASAQRRGGGGVGVGGGYRGGYAGGYRGGYGGYRGGYAGGYRGGYIGGIGIGIGTGYGLGYGGYGYGLGYGGYGNGFYGPSIGITPSYSSGYYSAPSTAVVPSETVEQPVVESPESLIPANSETAMQITDVSAGPARQAGLQRGDIILSVDGQRTRTFDELHGALTSKTKVSVEVFNPGTGTRSTKSVAVKDDAIGVSVVPTPVQLQ